MSRASGPQLRPAAPPRRLSPAVVVATAVVAIGLVGCSGGSSRSRAGTVGRGIPTSISLAAGSSTTVPGAATSTTAAGASSPGKATKGAGSGAGSGGTAADVSAALTPAAPGVYRYATSGVSTFNGAPTPFPAVTTLTVDPPTGTRQHSTRNLKDAKGNGPTIDLALDYQPQGVVVDDIKLSTTAQGFTAVQDLRPSGSGLLLPTGAGPGVHEELALSGDGQTVRLVVDVLRRERVTVGGRAVDTLVMHLVAALPPGDVTGTLDLTAWLAPSARLWVKERFVTDAVAAGGLVKVHSDYSATLQRLP